MRQLNLQVTKILRIMKVIKAMSLLRAPNKQKSINLKA
jgi:hypothetical protein|tara:strand:+ start:319 stop:432 length:114 start_codon:yes stop_codon:yes gene_type:complete